MTKPELNKRIVEETHGLSTATLSEVLDFIKFLKGKELKLSEEKIFENRVADELDELNKVSLVHLEEEFAHYKELYPYE